jgi:hypothetical protein
VHGPTKSVFSKQQSPLTTHAQATQNRQTAFPGALTAPVYQVNCVQPSKPDVPFAPHFGGATLWLRHGCPWSIGFGDPRSQKRDLGHPSLHLIRQPAIVQLSARDDSLHGASSTRFALTQPAKSSSCSTVSRASGASLIVRPSPRPFEAPLTAQLRLSREVADPTCEHHRNRAGEGVLVPGMNVRAGEHLLRNLSSYT